MLLSARANIANRSTSYKGIIHAWRIVRHGITAGTTSLGSLISIGAPLLPMGSLPAHSSTPTVKDRWDRDGVSVRPTFPSLVHGLVLLFALEAVIAARFIYINISPISASLITFPKQLPNNLHGLFQSHRKANPEGGKNVPLTVRKLLRIRRPHHFYLTGEYLNPSIVRMIFLTLTY
jgi:hypothetical protein